MALTEDGEVSPEQQLHRHQFVSRKPLDPKEGDVDGYDIQCGAPTHDKLVDKPQPNQPVLQMKETFSLHLSFWTQVAVSPQVLTCNCCFPPLKLHFPTLSKIAASLLSTKV